MSAGRVLLAVLLWVVVLFLTGAIVSSGLVQRAAERYQWVSPGVVTQVSMLALSLVLMLILGKGRLAKYGFRTPTRSQVKSALAFGSIAAVAVHIVLAVTWNLLPTPGSHPVMEGASFLQTVISVWIIASTCEEVFLRGLIQGFLEPHREAGATLFGLRLSLPVITAAVLFGTMHIMLFTVGAETALVTATVAAAIILGLVAGYYRERTGSLVPAILIHMLFNMYGSLSQFIQELAAG
jgi:membrane protease YdiL (CAAX protease family)